MRFDKRTLYQTFEYDWLGNTSRTTDDANGFYDRSLGRMANGDPGDAPYRIETAASESPRPVGGASTGDAETDWLDAKYDATGNMTTLVVSRGGDCLPSTSLCSQRYEYRWNEAGRLVRARRWDLSAEEAEWAAQTWSDDDSPPSAVELRYTYENTGDRVLKSAVDDDLNEVHSVYIFGSLELRRARWMDDPVTGSTSDPDYELTALTEVAYLGGYGRLVFEPAVKGVPTLDRDVAESEQYAHGSKLHVFFELGDHLGSTSVVLDQQTSELVEYSTFLAYGAIESDYRPERWGSFREDYKFTGKEEDIEVGLTYFGARYLNAYLGRWISPDPLSVHAAGGDLNVYAYVSGRVLQATDPVGLDDDEATKQRVRDWAGKNGYHQPNEGLPGEAETWESNSGTGFLGGVARGCLNGSSEACGKASKWLDSIGAPGAPTDPATKDPPAAPTPAPEAPHVPEEVKPTPVPAPPVPEAPQAPAERPAEPPQAGESEAGESTWSRVRSVAETISAASDLIPVIGNAVSVVASGVAVVAALGDGDVGGALVAGIGMVPFAAGAVVVAKLAYKGVKALQTARRARGLKKAVSGIPDLMCFTGGTPVSTEQGGTPIDSIQVGARVLTLERHVNGATEIDPDTWRLVRLEMNNPDGTDDVIHLALLRPISWIAEIGAIEGETIHVVLDEIGIEGPAYIAAVEPCPSIEKADGRVVTGTITHFNGYVLQITFGGSTDTLEPTQRHRFYSVDRDAWIQAGDLRVGERLRTARGTATIAAIARKPGVYRVYNLEVETEHSFFAGHAGVLSHNNCSLYTRPSGFRKGVRNDSWSDAVESSTGRVRDPKTGRFMSKDKDWDMGHKPGREFRKHAKNAEERGISREQFLNEHHTSSHFRPELPSSNRSHAAEDLTDNFFGP